MALASTIIDESRVEVDTKTNGSDYRNNDNMAVCRAVIDGHGGRDGRSGTMSTSDGVVAEGTERFGVRAWSVAPSTWAPEPWDKQTLDEKLKLNDAATSAAGSRPRRLRRPWTRTISKPHRLTSTTYCLPGACCAMASRLSLRIHRGEKGGKRPPWPRLSTWCTT
jgi:hypothetical protein